MFAGLQIRDSLTKRAREFNILVDDVAITHLSFGTEVCRIAASCSCHALVMTALTSASNEVSWLLTAVACVKL